MRTAIALRAAEARTFLFVPGTRPERFDKAVASGADLIVLDLEDAVATEDKNQARDNVVRWLEHGHGAVVRVNTHQSSYWADDIAAIEAFDTAVVMVPKSSDPTVLTHLGTRVPVIALIETARGLLAAPALSAAPGIVRTAFGHIDLAAELGIDPTGRDALLMARTSIVLAAAAAGITPPIDGVTTNIGNPEIISSDVTYAKSLGFSGKLCIHPTQIATASIALGPTPEDVAWAEKIAAALTEDGGVATVDGHMVDPPVLARAARILAEAKNEHLDGTVLSGGA